MLQPACISIPKQRFTTRQENPVSRSIKLSWLADLEQIAYDESLTLIQNFHRTQLKMPSKLGRFTMSALHHYRTLKFKKKP